MAPRYEWTTADFKNGYKQLKLLEATTITASQKGGEYQHVANSCAHLLRITTLLAETRMGWKSIYTPQLTARHAHEALSPYGLKVGLYKQTFEPTSITFADYEFPDPLELLTFGEIANMLPVPDEFGNNPFGLPQLQLAVETFATFQEVFACVSARTSSQNNSNVKWSADKVELSLRLVYVIARYTRDNIDLNNHRSYLAGNLNAAFANQLSAK